MRVLLALVMLSYVSVENAFGQQPFAPDACGAESLDPGVISACRRLAEEGRDQRCAAYRQARILPPTHGPRVLSFGDKTQFGSTSKGVVLESDGQTVVAPSAGRVLFAGTFRNYGNLVIIDACNVDVLVAGIETISTSAHALVEEGQVIGTMVGSGNPVYLEVRRANRAINPFGSLSE